MKKYYYYYQPNKKDLKDNYGDCSVRCICKALDLSWKDAYKKLIPYILEYQCPFMGMTLDIYKEVFKDLGFEYHGISENLPPFETECAEFEVAWSYQHREEELELQRGVCGADKSVFAVSIRMEEVVSLGVISEDLT